LTVPGRARVRELARAQGFLLAGIAPAAPSEHLAFLEGWVDAGYHGTMDYLARPDALHRRADPRHTMPEARSVVVVAHPYHQADSAETLNDPSRGIIAQYARGRDYHRVVKKKLLRLLAAIELEARGGAGGGAEAGVGRAYVDTGPLLERELARRAGLGWFGQNTLLIHPRHGSYFFLGALLLDLELEPDAPFEKNHCGTCSACLTACPTGALLGRNADGAPVMDARRCISYLTIEHRGPIPPSLRPLMGNRIYGCDICQEVCPFNRRFAEPAREPGYAARGPGERPVGVEVDPASARSPEAGTSAPETSAPVHPGTDAPSLVALLEMALDPEAWESFSRGSAIRRAGRAGFARNVCVAIGNWLASAPPGEPHEAGVDALAAALSDPEPLVRGHAAWALGRVGGGKASELMASAASLETDARVLAELDSGA
jgi:epoxyqueuosine reductase